MLSDTYDDYSSKSFDSLERDTNENQQTDNSFANTENRNDAPVLSPPTPPIRQVVDPRPLDILQITREAPAAVPQPFSFTFNNPTPTGSSIFNLF